MDSVGRDSFSHVLRNLVDFPELANDFVFFDNCHSLYSETSLSHYAILFGDFFGLSENDSLPRQLKQHGFDVRSFCNGDIFMRYPLSNSNFENFNGPSRDEMIVDLGTIPQFNWRSERYWETLSAYYGSADDEDRQMPEKWLGYIKNNVYDNNFVFLHFWSSHHPYGINEFLEEPLTGQNYGALGKELISRLELGDLSCRFVKNIYMQSIFKIINMHLRNLINLLKNKNIYKNSLIIITADHGEGLGDIGHGGYQFKIRSFLHNSLTNIPFFFSKFLYEYNYYNLDFNVFYHSGNHKLQKMVPLLIKFPNSDFGGTKCSEIVTSFDIVPTISYYIDNNIVLKRDYGHSLYSILSKNYSENEIGKLERRHTAIKRIMHRESLESVRNQKLDYFPVVGQITTETLCEDLIMGVNDYYSLGLGWHLLENWPPFIRWTEKKSIAYLKRSEKHSRLRVRLHAGIKSNLIFVYLNNGINSHKINIMPPDFQTIELPLPEYDGHEGLTVAIKVEKTWIPDNFIKNGDKRSIGVAVEKFWLE